MMTGKSTAVYVMKLLDGEIGEVYPPERNTLIEKTKNESLRRERYSVWKLLEYALLDAFGVDISALSFKRSDGGKWFADGVFFSLSHTSRLVAVAVSHLPIGVDIEEIRSTLTERTADRILTERECTEYKSLESEAREEYLIKKWSGKEALFKKEDLSAFIPHNYEPDEENTASFKLGCEGKNYILTVATGEEVELIDLSV